MASSTTKVSDEERNFLRQEASRALGQLRDEVAALDSPPKPWIPIDHNDNKSELSTSFECQFLNYTGFLHVPQFSPPEECASMKSHMADLVIGWDPDRDNLDSFGTSDQENQQRGDYFLESADRIHYFAEPTALEETEVESNGGCTKSSRLKSDFRGEQKIHALNKVGHALHREDGSPFTAYCESDKIRQLVVEKLNWRNPVVPQSMYIFKAAHHGGTVHAHQDSTYLYTTPHQSCLGLWLALDSATIDNGCLWLRPKSHYEPLRRQYKRNPGHFGPDPIDARSNDAQGDTSLDKFLTELLVDKVEVEDKDVLPTELTTVRDLIQQGFIPVECQAGDLLVFCGTLEHLSLPNHSNEPRHTFQLHLVEGPPYAEWSKYNWLQYPKDKAFVSLEKTKPVVLA